jgi:hypothetical protein
MTAGEAMNTQLKGFHREIKERGLFKFPLICYFYQTDGLKIQSLNQPQSEALKGVQ